MNQIILACLLAGLTMPIGGHVGFLITEKSAATNSFKNFNRSLRSIDPPANLEASEVSDTLVVLSWDTLPGDSLTQITYNVFQDSIQINGDALITNSFAISGLSPNTTYIFFVQANDAKGNSENSPGITVTTLPAIDTQAPTTPSELAASEITSQSVKINWTASSDNVAVAGYDIFRDGVKLNSLAIESDFYYVSGLAALVPYRFHVVAFDASGNRSSNSMDLNVVIPDLEKPSVAGNLEGAQLSQDTLRLSWTAASDNVAVTGYDVYQDDVRINNQPVTNTSYNIFGLNAGNTYRLYVIARDQAGNLSEQSNVLSTTIADMQEPSVPGNLTASNLLQHSLSLSWNISTDNVGVSGYDVFMNNIKINTAPVNSTSYNVTGLTAGTNYNFFVVAQDAAGNRSGNSIVLNLTTPDTEAPSAPSNLTSSNITSNAANLNWTVSSDNLGVRGYDIYKNGIKVNQALVTTNNFTLTGLAQATSYTIFVKALDAAGNTSTNSNTITVSTPCTGTGTINFQKWTNITGSTVASLTSNSRYPNSPNSSGTLSQFEIPLNGGDNYGMRVYGYICAPTTGNYIFWIAADDNAELWLSTNAIASNKKRIAYHTGYTSSRQWAKYPTQKSVAIALTAGQLYYVEALMKDGTQGDNMAVGWARPGQLTTAPSEVIPGSRLVSQLPDTQSPSVITNLTATNIASASLSLTWSVSTDNVGVTGYDVYKDNVKINAANITSPAYSVSGLVASTTYNFHVMAKDAAGNVSSSNVVKVTTAAPDILAPTTPVNVASSNITQTGCALNWNASTDNVGVAGYDVLRNGIKINGGLITTTTYNVTSLVPGTSYTFQIVAKDAAGNASTGSAPLTVTTLLPNPGTETFTQRTVIANQRMPHDLVYGPDNNLWYTERFGGTVSFVNPASGAKTVVLTLGSAMVRAGGQDGLMGLALHPLFRQGKPYVYISYTYQSTSATVRKTRIARYTYDSVTKKLTVPVTMLEDIPGSNDHNSARIAIGPDYKLYFTVGDMGAGQFDNLNRVNNAQNLNILEGKVLRLNTELINNSWIPADNPFTNTSGQKTAVFSLGHRNPQGLVWGNVNGTPVLYSSEHGPYSDDELNIIEPGRNYGWPWVAGFCDDNYNGRYIGGFRVVSERNNCTTLNAKEPIRSLFPVATPPDSTSNNMTWPSTAPSGTDFYGVNAIPGWQHSLLVAQLKAGTIARFKLSANGLSIISDTINYFRGKGRFRDVVVSADGLKIYVACDSSGSTSGPTGGVTSTPANPGSILEFTYQGPVGPLMANQLFADIPETQMKDKTIDVYPNPVTTYFIVYNYSSDPGRHIELYDIRGRLVKKQSAIHMATRIDVNDIANGIYVLKVTDAKGQLIKAEKMIIQK